MKLKGRDWLGAAATLFALAVTFNAEYEIAIAVHINPIVAYAVPGALDVYVLRALQVKRDVFLTVLAMVLVNAASHLVGAGVLAVSPALIVAVSAIAPLVLWRAHVLRHEASTERRLPWTRAQRKRIAEHVPADDKPAPEPCPYCDTVTENMFEHIDVCPRWSYAVPDFEEHAAQAVDVASSGTVNVPEHDDIDQITRAWEGKHAVPDEWDGTVVDLQGATENVFPWPGEASVLGCVNSGIGCTQVAGHSGPCPHEEARVLSLVPPLPAGFEPVLDDGDKEFLDRARELDVLSIRALKSLGMGNARAQRIQQYLKTEHNGGTA